MAQWKDGAFSIQKKRDDAYGLTWKGHHVRCKVSGNQEVSTGVGRRGNIGNK